MAGLYGFLDMVASGEHGGCGGSFVPHMAQ